MVSEENYGSDCNSIKNANDGFCRLTRAFKLSPSATVITSPVGIIEYANPVFLSIGGYAEADIASNNHFTYFFNDESADKLAGEIIPLLHSAKNWVGEVTLRKKDGSEYAAEMLCSVIVDDTLEPTHFLFNLYDITRRKKNEEELKQSEEKYQKLVENIEEIIYRVDEKGIVTYFSPVVKKMLGFEPEEIIGKDFQSFIYPEDKAGLYENFKRSFAGINEPYDFRVLDKNGALRCLHSTGSIVTNKTEGMSLLGVLTDITNSKAAEEKLKQSEEKYRSLVENINDIIFSINEKGVFTYVSPAVARVLKYDPKAVLGQHYTKFIHPDEIGKSEENFKNDLLGKNGPHEYAITDGTGEARYIQISTQSIYEKGVLREIMGVITDLTDKKKSDDALRESEDKYRQLVERANDGIIIIQDGVIKYVNRRLMEIWGGATDAVVGHPFIEFIHPDERPKVMERYKQRMAGADVSPVYESAVVDHEGRKIPAELNAGIISYQGKPADMVFVRDITERKKAEDALKEKEGIIESMAQSSAVATFVIDSQHKVLHWNKACEELTGAKAKDLIGTGDHWKAFYERPRPCIADIIIDNKFEDMPQFYKNYAKSELIPSGLHAEGWYPNLGGKNRYIVFDAAPIYDAGGNLIAAIETLQDMTGNKKTEEKLAEQYLFMESLIETIPSPVFCKDPNGTYIWCNEAFEKFFGSKKDKIIGKSVYDIAPKDIADKYFEKDSELLMNPGAQTYEWKVKNLESGEEKNVIFNKASFTDASGKVAGLIGVISDITDLKRAQESLLQTSEYLENLINYANAPIIVWGKDFKISRFNRAFERLTGYAAGEVIGKHLNMLFPDESWEDTLSKIAQTLAGERLDSVEISILCRDGGTKTALWNSANIYDKNNEIIATIAQGADITDLKKAEKAMSIELSKFKVLYELSLNMQEKSLDENLRFIVEKSRELLNSDTAYLGLCDDKSKEMYMHTLSGINTEAFKKVRLPHDKGLGGLVMQTHKGYIINDYFNDPHIVQAVSKIISDEGLVSGMTVPVQIGQTNYGVLYVFNRTKKNYSEEDLATLMLIGNLAAIEISGKRAQQELSESQRRMADIISFLPDATFVIDNAGKVIAWNKAIEDMTKVAAKDMLGKSDYEYAIPFYGERRPILADLVLMPSGEIEKNYSQIKREGNTLVAESYIPRIDQYLSGIAVALYDSNGNVAGAIESMRDITSRYAMENALKNRNALLNSVINSAKDTLIFALDKDYRYVTYNVNHQREMKKVYGADIAIGKCMLDYMTPEVKPMAKASYDRVLNGESFTEIQKQPNHDLWYEFSWNPTLSADAKIIGINVFVRDISERMKADIELKESEMRQKALLDNIPDMAWLKDENSRFIAVNESFAKSAGRKPEELPGKTDYDLWPEELAGKYIEDDMKVINSGKHKRVEELLEDATLGRRWIETIKTPIFDGSGKVVGTAGIARDITERKHAEEALIKSQNEISFKNTLLEGQSESSIDGILVVDHKGKTIQSNKRFAQMWNISKGIMDARDDDAMIKSVLSQLKEPGKFVEKVMHLYEHIEEKSKDEVDFLDGKIFERYSSPLTDQTGKNLGRIWYFHDITSRKKAEDALEDSHKRLTTVLDSIDSLVYVADLNSYELLFLNKFGRDIFGDKLGQKCWQAIQKGQKGPCSFCTNDKLVSDTGIPTGVYRWEFQNTVNDRCYECRDQAIPWTGKALVRMEIATDITERKKAEEGLKETKDYLNGLIGYANAPIIVFGPEREITIFNHASEALTGYRVDEVLGKTVDMFFPEKEKEGILRDVINAVFEGKKLDAVEVPVLNKSGEVRSVLWNSANIYDKDGKLQSVIAQGQDITERKRAEKLVLESETMYRALIETTGTGYVIVDDAGKVIDANPEYVRLTGRSGLNEIRGKSVVEWTADYEKEKNAEAVAKCARDGYIKDFDVDYVDKLGKITPVEINAKVMIKDNKPQILTLCRDITERKKAEEELKKAKIRMDLAVDASQMGVWELDLINDTSVRNLRHDQIFGYKEPILEWGAKIFFEQIIPEDRTCVRAAFEAAMETGRLFFECRILWPDKTVHWITVTGKTINDNTGKPQKLIGTVTDITNRKKAEESLQESEEKYRTLIEGASDQIFMLDRELRFLSANKTVAEMVRMPVEQLIGKSINEVFPPETSIEFSKNCKTIIETGKSMTVEEKAYAGVHEFYISSVLNPLKDDKGNVKAIIGIVRDITEQKKAEEALRESEGKLEDIIDFLPDATFVIDNAGKVIAWNKAIELMTGVKAENIIGKGNYEYSLCFYNERRPILIDYVLKPSSENEKKYSMLKSGNNALACEEHVPALKKDLWSVAVALYDAKGNIAGAIESIEDITEKKKIENALKDSEVKFKTFFNSASDAVFIIDPEGRLLEVNQAACDALGYARDELKSLTLKEVTSEGIEFFRERLRSTLESGSALFEGMHKRKDGSAMPVEDNSRAIDYEGKKAVLSICRDISERKKSEEKLRMAYIDLNEELKRQEAISRISSAYLSLEEFEESTKKALSIIGEVSGLSRVCIFENSPDGKSTTNTFSWIGIDASPIPDGQKIVSFDELPSFSKLMHEKGVIMASDVTTLPEDLSIAIRARGVKSIFILPLTLNNEYYGYITFSECKEHREWNYSDIILMTTVSQIISEAFERKISDEQLNKRNEEVENSKKAIMNINEDLKTSLVEQKRLEKIKTEFLSVTSHELRTPITPMKAQLQMVLGQYFGTLTKEQKTSLEMVLRNATRLDHLICDILDISKLESGNMKFIISTADLNELVKNSVETLKYNANEKNITLDMELGNIPPMSLDKDRITQVVMNLITNAVKFTDSGGRITVKTIANKDKAIVEVSDNGIGMEEEDIRRLFTPFFQVDSSRSRNHEGTGLGLAICKGVVINHGGEITVRSTPGKGSTFSFTLPYNEIISTKVVREVELFKINKQ